MVVACWPARLCPVASLLGLFLFFEASTAVTVQAPVLANATGGPGAIIKTKATAIAARDPSTALKRALTDSAPHKVELPAGTRERFAALQQGDKGNGDSPETQRGPYPRDKYGHFLNAKQLESVDSIHCLQERQRHPNRPCLEPEKGGFADESPLGIGHYPSWRDRSCHSNGEFFCDPRQMLNPKEEISVTEHLRAFKERTLVNCGQLEEVLDPDVERRWFEKKHPVFSGRLGLEDYREFNLAVALADEWPSTEMDPKSMEYFGRVVMTEWGLQPIYNGVDNGNAATQPAATWNQQHGNCPNTAVLFILPKYKEAYLTSPSCEFICESRGGPEVVAAALAGLEKGGIEAAVLAGIDEFERVLKVTLPLSIQKVPEAKRWNRGSDVATSDAAFVMAIRLVFAFVVFLVLIFLGSFIYFMWVPEKQRSRSGFSLMGVGGDRNVSQESYGEFA